MPPHEQALPIPKAPVSGATGRRRRRPRRVAAAVVVAVAVLAGCGAGVGEPESGGQRGPGPAAVQRYELSGDRLFPEGVAVDQRNGDFYVGSTGDGRILRGNVSRPGTEIFLPPGTDGRSSVTGLEVDPRGRLWVAGRGTGRLFVYDTASAGLIAALGTPPAPRTLLNDLAVTGRGTFVTDSFRPVIFRVAVDGPPTVEPWLDLTTTPVPTDTPFGLNGIAASADGAVLLTVHFDTGRLFRIDVTTREVTEVDLGGQRLTTGDGLLLTGTTLLVVREEPGAIYPVSLTPDLRRGRIGEPIGQGSFELPTTIAAYDRRLLIVNSQLDRATPRLPFTLSSLPAPG